MLKKNITFFRNKKPFFLGLLFCFFYFTVSADVIINNARINIGALKTRLVLDADAPLHYKISDNKTQNAKVILLFKTKLNFDLSNIKLKGSPILAISRPQNSSLSTEVQVKLNQNTKLKSFILAPQNSYGHRLVLDFYPISPSLVHPKSPLKKEGVKSFVVAIDAGHGGEDPGAIGKNGTQEKEVALAIAFQLQKILSKENNIKPMLIRDGDYFLTLRQRIHKARKYKADLFLSIHADSAHNSHARGSSVYVLSEKGASSEAARWLAHRENQSDLIGTHGKVNLKNKDKLLASVLLDLSMTAKRDASFEVADTLLGSLSNIAKLHKPNVEYAGFVVLKAPDIPSVLVETAFISNTQDEKKLKALKYRRLIAEAIALGIKRYIRNHVSPGTIPLIASIE